MGLEKEYTGKFVLGKTTPSYDLETEVNNETDISHLSQNEIHEAVKRFIGTISQLPPLHSAIKVGGKRAYEFARKGKDIQLNPRDIQIHEFEITTMHLPEVGFRIVCSKGTYIRSIVRDFGNALGVGAYLSALCRTRIGAFKLTDALDIDQVE